MDISLVSDGGSYSRNFGRISARSSQWFPATATSSAESGRGHGLTNGTPQPTRTGSNGPFPPSVPRPG
jgi:hypothetical protein